MLKIITAIAMSLLLLSPALAQDDECVTPEMMLEIAIEHEPNAYELDRLPVDGLGEVVFLATPDQEAILAFSFGLDGCWIGEFMAITVEDYESGTGKTFVEASKT